MKDYLFILNPTAGKKKADRIVKIINRFSQSKSFITDIIITESKGHATKIASESGDYQNIISVGGDGTLNEIINGINLEGGQNLGVLPVGSGNDFFRNINSTKSIIDNLDLFYSANKSLNDFDIGLIRYKMPDNDELFERRFLNSLGVGFDALVADINQKNKYFSGIVSYIHSLLKSLKLYQPIDIFGKIDNLNIVGKKLLITFSNGQTTGGGFYLTKNALIDDGLLDLCIIDFVSIPKLLRKLPKAIFKKIETVPEAFLRKIKTANIELKGFAFIHTDGEIISNKVTRFEIGILKNNLKLIKSKLNVI